MDKKQLVALLRQRDKQAWNLLYQNYSEKMMQICLYYVSDRQTAQDILHDGFILIFTSIDSLREPEKLESWMGIIMKNLALKYLNQCKATPTVPLSDIEEKEEPTDISSISDLPTYDTLLSIINQLPVGYQTVFKLSVLKGLSHKEIGMLLGITPHSSSSQLFRAKVMLRKLITHLHILTIVWICTLSFIIWLNMNKKDKSNNHSISTISNKTEKKDTKNLTKDVFLPQQAHLSHQAKIASRIYSRQKDSKDSTLATIQKADSMTTNNTISNQKKHKPTIPFTQYESTSNQRRWSLAVIYQGGSSQTNTQTSTIPGDISSGQIQPITTKEKTHHYAPVTFSLIIHYPIDKHWGIETGISYTRLRSDFTSMQEICTEKIQKIDYAGVSVKGRFNLWNYQRLSIYVSAGIILHIPIKATLKENILNNDKTIAIKKQTLNPSLQWSTGTGIGIQYQILPSVGVYMEPNLQYYFHNGDQLHTIWNEYPFNIYFPVGFRFSW